MELFVSQKEEITFCYNGSDIRHNEKNIFCDIRRKGKVKGLIDILQAHNKLSRFVSNIRTLFKDKDYQQTAPT